MKTEVRGNPSKAIAKSMLGMARREVDGELIEQELQQVSGGAIDSYMYFVGYTEEQGRK